LPRYNLQRLLDAKSRPHHCTDLLTKERNVTNRNPPTQDHGSTQQIVQAAVLCGDPDRRHILADKLNGELALVFCVTSEYSG